MSANSFSEASALTLETFFCIFCRPIALRLLDHMISLPSHPRSENKGLLFMETSALDSTNVEAAFIDILTGALRSSSRHATCWLPLISSPPHPLPPNLPAIHRKVASREVTRGSISAVTLSGTVRPTSEAQEEQRRCCKNS